MAQDVELLVVGVDPEPTLRRREPAIDDRAYFDPTCAEPDDARLGFAGESGAGLDAKCHGEKIAPKRSRRSGPVEGRAARRDAGGTRVAIGEAMGDSPRRSVALLDIDGTLLDSNDAHARAWVETLRRASRPVELARLRPLMGKGGDKVLEELLGLDADDPLAKRLGDERRRFFLERCLPSLAPTRGARALLERLKREGVARIVATSASGAELDALLRQAGVTDLVDDAVSASDAEHSKPDPDIVAAALAKSGVRADRAIMIGDTPYDIAAATGAGVDCVALRCGGGWEDAALAEAIAIYDDPAALLADWDRSPFAAAPQRALARAR